MSKKSRQLAAFLAKHKDLVTNVEQMQLPQGKAPVSVTMIVKDCAETLRKCLDSLRKTFLLPNDELLVVDTGSQDGGLTVKVAKEFGARVIERPDFRKNLRPFIEKWLPELKTRFEETNLVEGCVLDFAGPRQFAMEQAVNDIQFWIDSDDVLTEPQPFRLRSVIENYMAEDAKKKVDGIFLDYRYWRDPGDGAVTSILKRERVIRRSKYRWVGRCHETAISENAVPAYFHDIGSAIEHIRDVPDGKVVSAADIRNYIIIRNEIEEDRAAGRRADPRSIFYLGNAARGVRHPAEAIELYREFLPLSGSVEDRYAATYYIATIFLDEKIHRPQDALEWSWKCLEYKPDDPRGYFTLQRAYHQMHLYDVANHWYEVGRKFSEPVHTLHNYDPRHIHVLPHQVRALTAIKQRNKEDLLKAMDNLVAASPNHPETKSISDFAANWLAGYELIDSVRRVVANTHTTGQAQIEAGRRVTSAMPNLPDELEDMFLAHVEPKIEVVDGRIPLDIQCGKAPEAWGPRSGDSGIGGSEKAVIQMAPRLQARGFQVNVYANVPREQRGVDKQTGVNWQHFGAFDFNQPRETCIYWRAPAMLENQIGYTKRILWCHDVQNPANWTDTRCLLADQVWVLSEYHKSTLGAEVIAKLGDKIKVTRNGIDSTLLRGILTNMEALKVKRNPKRVIYASSPDRGAQTAMRIFEAAKKIDPEIQLHVFYGFNKLFIDHAAQIQYCGIPDLGQDGNLFEYWSNTLKMADRLEVPWHGRVGWAQLAMEMAISGVWLYPTRFPEISCMAAMEAMALGCIPVHSGKFALAETVSSLGIEYVIDPDNIDQCAKAVVGACNPDAQMSVGRNILSAAALEKYDYEKLADEWVGLLKD